MAEKKVWDQPLNARQSWVSRDAPQGISVVRQCQLAKVARSTVYSCKTHGVDEVELELLRLLDEEYTRHPFYGSRKMVLFLHIKGHRVNRKRVQRLMQVLGLVAMVPSPNTSKKHPQNPVFPYLLRGLAVVRPNQVWSTDITYIRLAQGFVYLVAIIDWYSRKVLAWQVSNTMDVGFCLECLGRALSEYGNPDIFNTDQGSQFTSDVWVKQLQENGIKISMDGRGRALDNIFVERLWRSVKYEEIYPKNYAQMPELLLGLAEYFVFYNGERFHQSLSYKTPNEVYETGTHGGAEIADYFSHQEKSKTGSSSEEMGQRQSAAAALTPS